MLCESCGATLYDDECPCCGWYAGIDDEPLDDALLVDDGEDD